MNKERELLQNILDQHEDDRFDIGSINHGKIRRLLAQPEPEQEPVAWRGINFTEAEGDWLYRDIDEPFTDSNYRNVGEALYLAPPRREPLSDKEIQDALIRCRQSTTWDYGFEAGVKYAEQKHGIGVGDE